MLRTRTLTAIAVALITCGAVEAPPMPHAFALTCTNPASGATWQINIDLDQSTVDTNPARISGSAIAWHDAKDGGNYTLNRATGELTVVVASSTGGYFLHDHCALPP